MAKTRLGGGVTPQHSYLLSLFEGKAEADQVLRGQMTYEALQFLFGESMSVVDLRPIAGLSEVKLAQPNTFADGATTPSVSVGNFFLTANTSATGITALANGYSGKMAWIKVEDANTTFVHSSSLQMVGGSDFTAASGDVIAFLHDGTNWYEVGRSLATASSSAQAEALVSGNTYISPSTFGDAKKGVEGSVIYASLNGLVGDGVTDDTAALQTIVSLYDGTTTDITIKFSKDKTYLLDTVTWAGTGNIKFQGGTIKLADSGQQVFDISGAQRVKFENMRFEGNATNQSAEATALIVVGTDSASTEIVSFDNCHFNDVQNLAIQVWGEGVGGDGADLVTLNNTHFVDCLQGAAGGQPVVVFIRGGHQKAITNNVSFHNCATVDAGKCLSYGADIAGDEFLLGIATNIVASNSGTTFFAQSIRNLIVDNVVIDNCGTSVGGTDYNVNYVKIDDIGADSLVTIENVVGRSNNATYEPDFRIEESTGSGEFVSQNVRLKNVNVEGDIVLGGTGGHYAFMCQAGGDFTVGGANSSFVMCEAVGAFNIQSANALLQGCSGANFSIISSGAGTSVVGGSFNSGFSDVNDGADNVTVQGVNFTGDARLRLLGSNQFAIDNTIITTADIALYASKAAGTNIVLRGNTVSATESFTTTPAIYLSNPLEIYVEDNLILPTSGRGGLGRISTTQAMRGHVKNNRGVKVMRNMSDANVATYGDLTIEDNGYYNSGVWTPMDEHKHVPLAIDFALSTTDAVPLSLDVEAGQSANLFEAKADGATQWLIKPTGEIQWQERDPLSASVDDWLFRAYDENDILRVGMSANSLDYYNIGGHNWFSLAIDSNVSTSITITRPSLDTVGGTLIAGSNLVGTLDGMWIAPVTNARVIGITDAAQTYAGLVFNSDGSGGMDAIFGASDGTAEDAQVAILNDTATDNILLLRAHATQSANAFSIENSAGTDQFFVGSDFLLNFNMTMANSTADPTADAPIDWVQININGTVGYMPVYAAT